MTPERWQQVKELFQAARECAPSQRVAWLEAACAGDAELRAEVESLLAANELPGSFMDRPAAEEAVTSLAPSSAADQAESLAGQTVGHYQLERQLGRGGMGVVYLARDARLGRPVALKLLLARFTQEPERVRRFQQEARAASSLNHPNIITIYELGRVAETHFIAAEFVEGQTLRALLAGGEMRLDAALDITLQAAGALQAAHEAGIVHRDIKPENIMVRPDGYVKLLDFGLAKLSERSYTTQVSDASFAAVETNPGIVMGTVSYMSPEQARGYEVDARTDIFSLGVVLYELIAGQRPFLGPTSHDVIAALLHHEPPPLAQFIPQLPVEMQQIIGRALAKEREARYQRLAAMLDDLSALKQRLEMEAQLKRAGHTTTRVAAPGRHRWRVVLGALALLSLIIAAYLFWAWRPAPVAPIQVVAVLPFKPLVAGQRDEVLELGIADTLITRLSSLKGVAVRPIGAVRRYTALDQDPVAAGRELQVQAVLEGSIQKAGDKIRVTSRLLSIADGRTLWTRQFDEPWTDIFAVQDAISQRVAGDLMVTLTGEERSGLARNYTTDPEAYQLYLMGRYHWNKRSGEGMRKSIESFRQAIDKDRSYALAYVGLADAYATLGSYHLVPPREALPQAREAAEQALNIDAHLAEAHATMGKLFTDYYWDWERAEKEFQRAIELKPNYPNAHHWYSTLLAHLGRFDEAVREATHALELDLHSPVVGTQLGSVLYRARRYDQGIAVLQKTLDLEPNYVTARFYLGLCYLMQGRHEEALAEVQKCRAVAPNGPDFIAMLGNIYGRMGKRNEARRHQAELNALARRTYVPPFNYVGIHAGLGEMDEAFKWLEKCFEERDPSIRGLKTDPLYDLVRPDPRFAPLLRRAGFE